MLESLRDIVIIIYGFLGIAATVLIIVLGIIVFRKISPILDSVRGVVSDVRGTTSRISNVANAFSAAGKVARWIRRRSGEEEESGHGK